MTDVDVDLASLPVGIPHTVRIPAGRSVRVNFRHRAPAAAYEIVVHTPGAPGGARPFPPMPPKYRFPAGCGAVQPVMDALLGQTEEVNVPADLASLKAAAPAAGDCVDARAMAHAEQAVTLVHPQLLDAGERAFLQLSRMRGTQRMAWTIEVVAAAEAPAWRLPSESAWIAASVATDVVEMAAFLARRPLPAPESIEAAVADGDRVVVSVAGTPRVTIDPATFVWSPAPYLSLAKSLLPRTGTAPRRVPPVSTRLLEALLRPSAGVLVDEDRRISAALSAKPASAAAHEEAALLLAAFALRERAAWLSDVRPALNRATAHLVLAEALRGPDPPGVEARIAAIALAALAERQTEALASVRGLPRSMPAVDAWARALELRTTGDWRNVPALAGQAPLVGLEAFHALLWRKTVPAALDSLEGVETNQVDWARVATGAGSVEVAHRFAPVAVGGTLAEVQEVHRSLRGQDVEQEGLAAALNALPGRAVARTGSPAVTVLGWGQWAAFLQRHLLAAVDTQEWFLRDVLGQREGGDAFAREADAMTAGLDLHALLVSRRLTRTVADPVTRSKYDPAAEAAPCRRIAEIIGRRPEAVPFEAWDQARRRCPQESARGALPPPEDWFRPLVPPGTAYQAVKRMSSEAGIRHGLHRIDVLHALAPYDASLGFLFAGRRYGGEAKADEFRAAMGPVLDYDIYALERWTVMAPRETAVLTEVGEKLCAMAADRCFGFGERLALEGREDEAIAAYEKAIAGTRDAVQLAASVAWVVDRLWDTARRERAMEIAQTAGEAHSSAGLFTLARALERAGRLEEAEKVLLAVTERYGDTSYLDSFHIRRHLRFGEGTYRQKGAEALARRFPRGLQKVTTDDFHAPPGPLDGVPQLQVTPRLAKLGVRPGDVVVAVDGYRVRDNPQWIMMSSLTDEQALALIVWRGGGYAEIKGPYLRLKYGP
jgi:hypothetical protein